jgi:hypothetical protein
LPYWTIQHELTVDCSLILREERILIPGKLRSEIPSQLKASHLGIEKTKQQARIIVQWTSHNADIERMVQRCYIYQNFKESNQKESLISTKIPLLP